jgi:CheY-like chemotaxis protein
MLQKEPSDLLFLDVTMPEQDVKRILDFVSSDHRLENLRTVVITRNDVSGDQQEWMRRAAAEVMYEGHEHPEALLDHLRGALTTLGATVES